MFVIVSTLLLPPPPRSTLFPYTTLFRSLRDASLMAAYSLAPTGRRGVHTMELDVRKEDGSFDSGVLDVRDRVVLARSEEHTSELQSLRHLVCRLLLEKKNQRGQCTSP